MGIPSYFHTLIRTYGSRFFGSTKRCSRLFLDLNCCIHGCKNRVLSEFTGDLTTKKGQDIFEKKVIDEVIKTIIHFCKKTNPEEMLWIAVDGVVPLAKMVQQRERRMRSVEDREEIRKIYEEHGKEIPKQWDSNAITPGTPFMIELCKEIHKKVEFIKKEASVKQILINDVTNPGEGEQKIFEYMRKYPGTDETTEDVIYGLDADLIILSLLHSSDERQKSSISLLREEQAFGKLVKDDATGKDVLIRFAVSEMGKMIPLEWSGKNDKTLIYDYVVLMSLMGNDFVPHSPSLTFRSEGMERILDAYRKVDERIVIYPEIQWKVLSKVFEVLQEEETKTLKKDEKRTDQIRRRIRSGEIPFKHAIKEDPVEQEIARMDWKHLEFEPKIKVDEKGWESKYYKHMGGVYGDYSIMPIPEELKKRVCDAYLYSIWWCWNYYIGIDIPADICYSFASAPLLRDASRICNTWSPPKISKYLRLKDIPVEAQLLVVLPVSSHKILPKWVQDIAKECDDLYISGCSSWTYGKRHIWECTSILPRIPIRRITRLLNERTSKI
jgi:5'-3' exonuclease